MVKSMKFFGGLLASLMLLGVAGCNSPIDTGDSGTSVESVESTSKNAQSFYVSVRTMTDNGTAGVDKRSVEQGEDVIVTFFPSEGYFVSQFFVNGVSMYASISNNQAVIKNVQENLNIEVSFDDVGITYVSEADAPTVDGELDAVWDHAMTFTCSNLYPDNQDSEFMQSTHLRDADIKVMWNEKGFYFFGYIYDSSVNAFDRCNFWVSEIYTSKTTQYSQGTKEGNYFACINPYGENLLYDPGYEIPGYVRLDISQYWTIAVKIVEEGYIIEMFVPQLGENSLVVGGFMGFNVSVDYVMADNRRDYYANINNLGSYWSNPSALKAMVLLG